MAAGLAVLAVGPVVALSGHSHPGVAQVRTPITAAVPAGRDVAVVFEPRQVDELDVPVTTPVPTPAPTPAPVHHDATLAQTKPASPSAPPPPPGSVEAIIRAAAAQYGVSGDWMVKIARCESGLNPHAYNPGGPYYGLFQFLASTFRANGGTNIWDPTDQARVTAKMLAHGQAHQWGCA